MFAASPAIAQQPGANPSPVQHSMPTAGGGRVLYFQKPAESQATVPEVKSDADVSPAPTAVPASSNMRVLTLPAASAPAPSAVYASAQPLDPAPQPGTKSTSDKLQPIPIPKNRPEWTQLPPRDKIFLMYDDAQLESLIIRQLVAESSATAKLDPAKLGFPDLSTVRNSLSPPGSVYHSKTVNYDPRQAVYEPGFIIHRRLYFNEPNAERYGWDLGFIQPVVSAAFFFKDFVLIPNSVGTNLVTGFWDTNAGKCLPGNSVPYLAYPPGLSITGSIFEAGVIVGLAFIIP